MAADLTTGEGMEGALVGPGVTEKEVLELEETEREVSELEGIAKGALGLPESERGALGTGIDRIDPKKEQEWCECLFVSKVFVKSVQGDNCIISSIQSKINPLIHQYKLLNFGSHSPSQLSPPSSLSSPRELCYKYTYFQ